MEDFVSDEPAKNGVYLLRDYVFIDSMSDIEDAVSVVERCSQTIRWDIVDTELAAMLWFSHQIVKFCPTAVYEELRECWTRLLERIARACERQSCCGSDKLLDHVMSWGLMNIKYVFLFIHRIFVC